MNVFKIWTKLDYCFGGCFVYGKADGLSLFVISCFICGIKADCMGAFGGYGYGALVGGGSGII